MFNDYKTQDNFIIDIIINIWLVFISFNDISYIKYFISNKDYEDIFIRNLKKI